ncbi:MAG TPA: glycosyltransferase family 4 protein [Burkholderiaceae bacterium]|jgi:glycosyltransferase involved in cell wall biosynthesis
MTAAAGRPTWLFVDAIAHFGGHEAMLLRWLEELAHDGSVVPRLLAREGGRLAALAPASTRVAPFPPERTRGPWRRLRNAWAEAKALRLALKQERPERVVFASGALGYQMLLVVLARLWGERVLVYVPLLDTFEAMGYRAGRAKDRFVRWFYSRVPQGWIAISGEQAAHFRTWARPSGPVFVLPNTVARAIEQAPRLAPAERGPDERLRVLVLGRLDAAQKGLDLLLAHLETAPRAVQDGLHVRLAGEGPYRGVLEARLRADPALARCLTLADWMPGPQAMAGSDVLLLTSRFEGVPLVMLEAMALGLPVVASDLPGIRAHVADECLFAVGELARAVAILQGMRDRGVRERRAAEGRARYEAAASSGAFARAVTRLVQEVRAA